jgi:hypothetical protein
MVTAAAEESIRAGFPGELTVLPDETTSATGTEGALAVTGLLGLPR